MIKVHHLEKSRSHRVLWLLEELGLDYEIVEYRRDPKTILAPPELKAIHPLGKAPVVEDGGRIYAESGAIIEHLLDAHGGRRLRPQPGSLAFDDYRYWLHFAEGSGMFPLLLKLYLDRLGEASAPVQPRAKSLADTNNAFMEATLSGRDWFAGEFSAADIQMSYVVEMAPRLGGLDQRYPRLQAWLERVRARPAYKRAIERGGPVLF